MIKKSLFFIITAIVISGCAEKKKAEPAAENEKTADEIISPFELNDNMMSFQWQSAIPLKAGEKIAQSFTYEGDLFAVTSKNLIFCLDRITGELKFVKTLSEPGLPVSPPVIYDSRLYFSVGSQIVIVDPKEYKAQPQFRMDNPPVANLVIKQGYLYAALTDKRLRCYDLDDNMQVFSVVPDDQSGIQSFAVDANRAYIVSNDANVYGISRFEPVKYWANQLLNGIPGDIIVSENSVYVAGEDGMIYKINSSNGVTTWKAVLGTTIDKKVRIVDGMVMVETLSKGVYAISDETGEVLWHCDGCRQLVSMYRDTMTLLTDDSLVVVKSSNGEIVKSVKVANPAGGVFNQADSMSYVYDYKGNICCVDELK
ncbi:outer membrane biogenesis protein BamB [Limihaloglobus sulfuriphilus]|uniref:Outer membrane biogenesis protein BamB n=1 Tax=Limihaloglobus sulfuriphilus TaxID=1851148 RepID=A0A1Q2MDS8_9BACT|nr:PQQ-binding-like beta-propeller repeat protein [Limihaloglobus sulfuriphilus]AQQ70688.1 outer membrane biogenesis protein BamB [Limihaloglobus sulfuriphilus]